MCGIVGAVSQRNVVPILIEGLRKLEYRGYDSAGMALMSGAMERVRSVGRVSELEARIREMQTESATIQWRSVGHDDDDGEGLNAEQRILDIREKISALRGRQALYGEA